MSKIVNELMQRISKLEERLYDMSFDMKTVAQTEVKKTYRIDPQANALIGIYNALCVDTVDPWKQGRVRFYSPLLNAADTDVTATSWAYPISSMGGFDDSGLTWVPPAGSMLCLIFEGGNRDSPYYLGTTWNRDRGPTGGFNFDYPVEEFYNIHSGHRKGYLVGPNDESQVFPPWNTENYNGLDIDSIAQFEKDPDAQRKITQSNIYGFKTPQKHGLKFVDGNYKCNHRAKRIDLQSSCGNWVMLKDDHIHYCGQWAHPSCGAQGSEIDCNDENGVPLEKLDCSGKKSNSSIKDGHPSTGGPSTSSDGRPVTTHPNTNKGSNPYFKHENECRPFKGPQTPQNNRCDLPQSGIQLMSISGHTMVFDDSVEEPSGIPNWERSTKAFDFGCSDKFQGRTYWKSATGHVIEMSDVEESKGLRGENNYIKMVTASGNKIELNDHTQTGTVPSGGSDQACPPNVAGERRGILLRSTSNNTIQMGDEENEQCSPIRKDGGRPTPKAKKAFIKIRTGYGLRMDFLDNNSQEETQNQEIQILAPQKDNKKRGPHLFRMSEKPSGPGQVQLVVGGNYQINTYDQMVTVVGDKEKNPANKRIQVSKNFHVKTEESYINLAKQHVFKAEKRILLLAGRDCPGDSDAEENCARPCVFPVLIARCPRRCPYTGYIHWTERAKSERVFASGKSTCATCGGAKQRKYEFAPSASTCAEFMQDLSKSKTNKDC